MKTVYFVRHGQSESNRQAMSSHNSDPLTELGRRQAEAVRERLVDLGIEVLLASPYIRTQQTAEIINEALQTQFITEPLLEEQRNISSFRGTPFNDPQLQAVYQELREHAADPNWHYADEENFYDVFSRSQKLLDLLANRPEETILAVTHGNILRALVRTMLLGELFTPEIYLRTGELMSMSSTGITVCALINNTWKLVRWNDTVHLTPELYSRN